MIVATVDQGDFDRGVFEGLGGTESAEAAAENYHFVEIRHFDLGDSLALSSLSLFDDVGGWRDLDSFVGKPTPVMSSK